MARGSLTLRTLHSPKPPGGRSCWRSCEAGQASAEYAGSIVIVVTLVAVLVLAAPIWGQKLVCGIGSALASITGGSYTCGPADGDNRADPPAENGQPDEKASKPPVCTKGSHEGAVKGAVGVGVTVEGNGGIKVEEMSDGSYRITDSRGLELSKGKGGGGGAVVKVGGRSVGVNASASAGGERDLSENLTYIVHSESEKKELVNYLKRQGAADIHDATNPVIRGAGRAANWLYNKVTGYTPPKAAETTIESGKGGSASVDVSLVTAHARGSGGVRTARGTTINHLTGESTMYYQVDASVDGSVNLPGAGGAAPGAQGEGMIAVTWSPDGKSITKVSYSALYYANGDATVVAHAFDDRIPGGSDGMGRYYQGTVNISNGQVPAATADLLRAHGIPLPGGSESAQPLDKDQADKQFIESLKNNNEGITRQDVTIDSKEYGADVDVKALLDASLSGSYTSEDRRFSNGQIWDGNGWTPWEGCQ